MARPGRDVWPARGPAARPAKAGSAPASSTSLNVSDVVRRIEQNQIEGARDATARRTKVAAGDSIAALQAAHLRVLLDERRRATVLLDERHVRRATTQGLDAECAGAGVCVEDARPGDARRQDVEQCLAQLVGRRPDAFPRRRLEPAAFELTAITRTTSTPAHAEACAYEPRAQLIPDLDQSELLLPPLLHEGPELLGQAALLHQTTGLVMCRLHDVAIANQVARPQLRKPGLTRAEHVSRAAQLEVAFGDQKPSFVDAIVFRRSRASSVHGA